MKRVKKPPVKRRKIKITPRAMEWAKRPSTHADSNNVKGATINPFVLAPIPPNVLPSDMAKSAPMAMDDNITAANTWSASNATAYFGNLAYVSAYQEGLAFPGYPFLAELAQRPEYRRISETLAMEMTRKWIKLQSVSADDDSKNEAIKQINDELERLHARDAIRKCIELDGFFGRAHLYIDTGATHDRAELKTPIADERGIPIVAKVARGSLKRIKAVEPVWTYPTNYDSIDPLTDTWYEPDTWFVMGKEVHKTRLLKFVGREVPDLLKPAYSFGGLSMSQMALPYVNNWLRTRQSVADIIHAFSVFVLATDMSQTMQEDGDQIFERADWFNWVRDNKGMMLIDKDSEEFQNVSASLASLDALQAQTQEHMASVSGIPIVKLLGIQPAGLNASSEGELRSFFDWILAMQEKMIRQHLTMVIDLCMLNLWGRIDKDITFAFEPLWSLDEKGMAEVRAIEADTSTKLIESGVLHPEEDRKRVATDPESPYASIEIEDVPDLREEEEQGLMPKGGAARVTEGAAEEQGEIDPPNKGIPDPQGHETGTGMKDGEDKEPSALEKHPYFQKQLRPDYIRGKNPLLHRWLKGSNALKGSQLRERFLNPKFLTDLIATLEDEGVDRSSLDVNAGEGTGGRYERDTSIGSPYLDSNYLRSRIEEANASNPDRYEDDEQRGSPHNRELAMRALDLLRRRADGEKVTGRNDRTARSIREVRVQGGGLGDRTAGGLRREASRAEETRRGNEDDEVGRWENWAEDDIVGDEGDFKESDHPRDDDGKFTSGGGSSGSSSKTGGKFTEGTYKPKPKLKMSDLSKVGGKLGSNPGGKYEDSSGNKFYIKQGKSKAHVSNEYLAADLFKAAGGRTQKYRDVEGGDDIATEWENYEKNNAKDFTAEEKKKAQKLFAIHAWLANWDAAGLDYDNQAIAGGQPVALDLGGALEYRAQGAPKGDKFGNTAGEWDTMRDSKINPQNAQLFKGMSNEDLKASAAMVDRVSDYEIERMVEKRGKPKALAEKLIERKRDIGARAAALEASGDPKEVDATVVFNKYGKNLPKELNGIKFKEWEGADDWANVEGQMELADDEKPELKKGQRLASGLVIEEDDGRVWIFSPAGGYGGYDQTFPKGGVEKGLSMQANAIKEAWEETGLKAEITGHLGDFQGDTSVTRFYRAKRTGGDPNKAGWESEAVMLAPRERLSELLNRSRDRKIAEGLASDEFVESQHPRDNDGKFSKYQHTIGLAGQGESGKAVKKLFEDLGFEKGMTESGKHRYVSKNLDVVVVEPPKGGKSNPKAKENATPWSSLWTLYPKNGDIVKGKGNKDLQSELEKLKKSGVNVNAKKDADKVAEKVAEKPDHDEENEYHDKNMGFIKGPAGKGEYVDFKNSKGIEVNLYDKKTNEKIGNTFYADSIDNAKDVAKSLAQGWLSPTHSNTINPLGAYEVEKEKPKKEEPKPKQPTFEVTPSDLEKAKKTTAFYAPNGVPKGAEKVVEAYNKLYEGKQITDPDALKKKVLDYKATKAIVDKLAEQQMAEQQKKQAEQAKKQKEYEEKNKQDWEKAFEGAYTQGDFNKKLDELRQEQPEITAKQRQGIYKYTGGSYNSINTGLRHNNESIKAGSEVAEADDYLKKCSLPKDAVVFRKVSGEYAKILRSISEEGTIFKDRGFMSTSVNPSVWHGSMLMVITAKKGAKGTSVKHMSANPSEDEVLFAPGRRMRVTKMENHAQWSHGVLHVEMENE